jgi:3(or 17)beta-hydroxysteroid dehydrogenase
MKDKLVFISGSTRGIGLSCARLALKEGAKHVFITDFQDQEGEKVADELGASCSYHHLDVSDEDNWITLLKFVEKKYGQLDVLINNAGITGTADHLGVQDMEGTQLASWRKVHQVNLDGIFLGCKIAMPLLSLSASAAIVNVGSRSALFGRHDRVAYASSKAAISSITKSVAMYAAEKNYAVRCNTILPSTILTRLWEPVIGDIHHPDQVKLERISSRIPMKRFGDPIEVAKAILFLASDEASYINGTDLIVDGGASARDCLRM